MEAGGRAAHPQLFRGARCVGAGVCGDYHTLSKSVSTVCLLPQRTQAMADLLPLGSKLNQ
jgi:hypothetical protein